MWEWDMWPCMTWVATIKFKLRQNFLCRCLHATQNITHTQCSLNSERQVCNLSFTVAAVWARQRRFIQQPDKAVVHHQLFLLLSLLGWPHRQVDKSSAISKSKNTGWSDCSWWWYLFVALLQACALKPSHPLLSHLFCLLPSTFAFVKIKVLLT